MISAYLSRIGAMLTIAAGILAALALAAAFTGCTTPKLTVPLVNADRFGSISAYGVIAYEPAAFNRSWTPDADTLGDK